MKYLVVGLGNIGNQYQNTRHNIGFSILEHWANSENFFFETSKLAERSLIKVRGKRIVLLKPSTFMNLSGKAVRYWLIKEKIPIENLLILTDDLNLPFGKIRLRTKGSDGGHNGLRDIQEKLETNQYCRLRFGLGSEFVRGAQVDFVLSNWSEQERMNLTDQMERAISCVKSFVQLGPEKTMNLYNRV